MRSSEVFQDGLSQPEKLFTICTNLIIKKILAPLVPVSALPDSDLQTSCQWNIVTQVCRHYLSSLPTNLNTALLDQAHAMFDNHFDVHKLLLVLLSTLGNSKAEVLKTPLYLYSNKPGRKRLLENLLDTDCVEVYSEAHLDMYNFYHRPDLTLSWRDDLEDEFQLLRLSLSDDETLLVHDFLERSVNLTVLSIHTVATNQMLSIISKNCVNLAKLDVSFSKNVSDNGMAILATSIPLQSSLKMLKAENTMITQSGVFILLEHLDHLEYLESSAVEDYIYCMQNFFSKSNVLDAALVHNTNHYFKIKKLMLSLNKYYSDKLSIFYVLTMIFPNVSNLSLHSVHRSEFENIHCLSHLSQLNSLMVGSTPLQCLIPVFTKIGRNLTTFCFINYNAPNIDINFSIISELCENLENVTISGHSLVHSDISENALKQLKHVTINAHAHIPCAIWTYLLSSCNNLISLSLTKCENLNDKTLKNVLNRKGVKNVTKFIIKGCHKEDIELSEHSVELLKQIFSEIEEIGDLFSWSLTPKDYSVTEIRRLM